MSIILIQNEEDDKIKLSPIFRFVYLPDVNTKISHILLLTQQRQHTQIHNKYTLKFVELSIKRKFYNTPVCLPDDKELYSTQIVDTQTVDAQPLPPTT